MARRTYPSRPYTNALSRNLLFWGIENLANPRKAVPVTDIYKHLKEETVGKWPRRRRARDLDFLAPLLIDMDLADSRDQARQVLDGVSDERGELYLSQTRCLRIRKMPNSSQDNPRYSISVRLQRIRRHTPHWK